MTRSNSMNTLFIGGGNMGRALIGGLLKKGFDPKSISTVETDPQIAAHLMHDFSIHVLSTLVNAQEQLNAAQVVIIAVKPQDFKSIALKLSHLIKNCPGERPLVLSIAAGIPTASMAHWLHYGCCVRAMPNTPALINQGMTGLFAPATVSEVQRKHAEIICSSVGQTVWIDDESLMDAVTAVSGSGPAYVFAFLEALQSGGERLGLPAETARQLAYQTVVGAAALAMQSNETPSTLRQKVTSKGGTTAAALGVLEQKQWQGILEEALAAAKERGVQMAKELGST